MKKANVIDIQFEQLPLYCPNKNMQLWSSHPKVYLPIEKHQDKTAQCPYCGTVYKLFD